MSNPQEELTFAATRSKCWNCGESIVTPAEVVFRPVPLDEERLARALTDLFPAAQRDRWPFTPEQAAAAVAKAYRENKG